MIDPKLIEEARRLLANVTPLPTDCGELCGHICCSDFAPNVGVYLIPGELAFFDGDEEWATFDFHSTEVYEFAPTWERFGQIPFLKCTGLCSQQRDKRPFECRTYPLVPLLLENGQIEMRYAPWAEGICPLADRYRLDQLNPEFVEACRRAWEVLMESPEMRDHVRWQSDQLREWYELPHLEDDC